MKKLSEELLSKPGYLKCSPAKIAERFNVSQENAANALKEAKDKQNSIGVGLTTKHIEKDLTDEYREFLEWKKSREPKVKNDYRTPGKYIILGCVHAPFHRKDMMKGVIKLLKDNKDSIKGFILAGDFLDLNSLSSHDRGKKPLQGVTLDWEYQQSNLLLDNLLEELPEDCLKGYIWGNHEDRYKRYMSDIDNSKLGSALKGPTEGLKLIERGFEVYEDWKQDVITLGNYLDISHGEFFNTHSAKKHIDTYRRSMLYYHTHRIQQYIEGNVGGFNGGSLADFDSPVFGYASRAMKTSWMNGFNTVDIDSEGFYHLQQIVCYNNKFVYGNKTYKF